MRVDLVFPVLPPVLDGIGDHTACLAKALAAHCKVRILTAQEEVEAIPGVAIEHAFSIARRREVRGLLKAVQAQPPDWLFLQFNQFSYGRRGLNPYLPLVIREIKRVLPATRVAWMAHEDFMPLTHWKTAIMSSWQRWQFWMLGRYADLILFSIDPWVQKYQSWFPHTRIEHLPVGSNIPLVGVTREEARRRIGLDERTFVVGLFGTAHGSRLLHLVRAASHHLRQLTRHLLVLYVGPHGEALRDALGEMPVMDAGRLPAENVSIHLAAMNVHLAPFLGGVSTRRGSFMAGIQHGVATVSTEGFQTDQMLREANGRAFLLSASEDQARFIEHTTVLFEDAARRMDVARAGQQFYRNHFDWPMLASRLMAMMEAAVPAEDPVPALTENGLVSP